MSVEFDSLEIQIQASSDQAARGIDRLTAALTSLKSVAKGGAGLTAVINQLDKLGTALPKIQVNTGKLGELKAALDSLSNVQKATGLSSTVNALKKLPDITKQLDSTDLDTFATQMERVANAVRPLATEMQKVSNGFAAFPIRIQKIISSNTGLASSNSKLSKSYGVLGTGISSVTAKFSIYSVMFRRVASVMSGWISESNAYVENLNLFTVAMGDAAEEAYNYAYAVRDALGIDPSEWMRNQGVFKQITSGFGVVEDKANLMSKNLTQIGYDISSFFNISIEDAMQKVQSGISGELEPLRRLGYALDQATLQQIAYTHGINQNISTMTQAQKSQLRYLAIMQQSTNVMGDMARTIQTPANAMRILSQQVTQLSRALGNLLIPFLQAILPYLQAFVELLTEAVQWLAALVGFELPKIDYSGVGDLASSGVEAGEALEGAAEAAKDLKNATIGIDELNIISPQAEISGSGGVGGLGGDLGIELPEYDFLAGLDKDVEDIKEKLKELLLDYILPIGAGLLAWKIASSLIPDLGILKGLLGSLMVAVGVSLLIDSIEDIIINKRLTWDNILKGAGGGIIAGGGLGMMLAKKFNMTWKQGMLRGAGIGLGVSLMVMGVTAMVAGGIDVGNVLVTAIGAALVGGIAGMNGLKKLNSNLGSGQAFGVGASIGLMLTFASVNFGGLASGAWDASSWQSVLLSTLTAIAGGIAGAGIIGGPAGIALGVGIGLVISIASVSFAQDQEMEMMVQNSFFDEQGVLIADLSKEYENLIQKLGSAYEPINTSWEAISSGKESIDSTTKSIDLMIWEIENGATTAEEAIPQIKDLLNSLYPDTLDMLTAERDLIFQALAGVLGESLEKAGEYAPDYVTTISAIYNDTSVELEKLKKEMEVALETGDIETFNAKWVEFEELAGRGVDGVGDFTTAISNMNLEDINWGDLDSAKSAIDGVGKAFDDAKLNIEEWYKNVEDALLHFRDLAETPEQKQKIDLLLELNEDQLQLDIGALEETAYGYINTLYDNILEEADKIGETALSDWEGMSFLDQLPTLITGGNADTYVLEAVGTFKTDIVDPLGEQISQSFGGMFGEDSPYKAELDGKLLTFLGDLLDIDDETMNGIASNLGMTVGTSVAESVVQPMEDAGIDADAGFANSLKAATNTIEAVGEFSSKVIGALHDGELDFGSPSHTMEEYGLWTVEGFAIGIQDGIEQFFGSESNVFDQSGFIESFKSAFTISAATVEEVAANMKTSVTEAIYNPTTETLELFTSNEFMGFLTDQGGAIPTGLRDGIIKTREEFIHEIETLANDGISAYKAIMKISSPSRVFEDLGKDTMYGLRDGIALAGVEAVNEVEDIADEISRLMDNIVKKVSDAADRISSTLRDIRNDISDLSDININTNYSVRGYASGGFPEQGQLFLAQESGPEMVGRIGGRTAVANNDQIVAGIAAGVYDAVYAAMTNAGGEQQSQPLVVYLDGEQIYNNQQSIQRSRGYSFGMGAFAR